MPWSSDAICYSAALLGSAGDARDEGKGEGQPEAAVGALDSAAARLTDPMCGGLCLRPQPWAPRGHRSSSPSRGVDVQGLRTGESAAARQMGGLLGEGSGCW